MDLSSLQKLATGQGPLFWGAAAAAALGVALLVAAGMLGARRLPRPRLQLRRRRGGRAPGGPAVLVREVPGGYAPIGWTGPLAAVPAPTAPDYGQALARLRRASEQLARLQQDGAESRLKPGPGKADLLSRRGVG